MLRVDGRLTNCVCGFSDECGNNAMYLLLCSIIIVHNYFQVLTDITERDQRQHVPPEHGVISPLPLDLFHDVIDVVEAGHRHDFPFQFRYDQQFPFLRPNKHTSIEFKFILLLCNINHMVIVRKQQVLFTSVPRAPNNNYGPNCL